MAPLVAAILLPLSSLCERTKNILVLYRENPRLAGNIVATNAFRRQSARICNTRFLTNRSKRRGWKPTFKHSKAFSRIMRDNQSI
jgi:hypothetical protein